MTLMTVLLTIYLIIGAILAFAYVALDSGTRGTPSSFLDVLKFIFITVLWLPALVVMLLWFIFRVFFRF